MNEITRDQAGRIWDLETYKQVTGAKRFKRTKEEMQLGLSPEEALQRRLDVFRGNELPMGATGSFDRPVGTPPRPRASTSRKGDITIHIRAAVGTDPDYFEHIPNGPVEIVLDQNWFSWFDNKMNTPYEGDHNKLLRHILEMGIGQVITTIHFEDDLREHERLTDFSTMKRPGENDE